MKEFDIISIGGGRWRNRYDEPGRGSTGARAAVIEEKQLGGTCVNRGCVPKNYGMVHKSQKLFAIMDQTMDLLLNRPNLILQP